MKVMEHFA